MSMKFIVCKRMLTQYCNKLDKVILQFKEEELHKLKASSDNEKLEEAIGALEAATSKVERTVQEYASLYSTVNQPEAKEAEDFEDYISKAESSLSSAFEYGLTLQARNRALKAGIDRTNINAHACSIHTKKMELPTLPIPSFSGDIWEWDNFWELFNSNVHSQDLPELYKFNYLLNALEGEARESVKKFQIANGNYVKVVDFLMHKYGNRNELVQRLIERFEQCFPRSSSLKDQRPLLEQLQATISQLERKGEIVDNQWMQKQVLSKFPLQIQRSVLTRKQALDQQAPFLMQDLLKLIDEVLACEEMVSLHTKETRQAQSPMRVQVPKGSREYVRVCMYCGGNHKSIMCTKYSTPRARSQYLREHQLCLICASPQHTTAQCMKRKCFNCQGLHHTSCCFKKPHVESPFKAEATDVADQEQKNHRRLPRQTNPQTNFTKKVNHLTHEAEVVSNDAAVYGLRSQEEHDGHQTTFLPTGELTVLDQERNILKKVCVLFDTGAEISFIDKALADDLHLPIIRQESLRIRTFGSKQVQEKICQVVQLKAWDLEGEHITIDLLTYDIISKCLETPSLSNEDLKYLRENHIPLDRLGTKQKTKPQILLGCDKLWSFINEDKQQLRLPSGLHFIETRMGYLITGQLKSSSTSFDQLNEKDKWDGYWSLDTQVNAVSIAEDDNEDEQGKWDKFWSLDAAGTERFGHSENAEQAQTDKNVLQHFMETVEKREDGYYVRLPWKEHFTDLPDNKAIAQRRLVSLWTSLRKDPDMLHKYDEVFQDQLRRNVLEYVPKEETEHKHLHYLPHQAVITPHKTTTKLRVVYDASAHYRNCPSLNDALHRGPVILPQLFGVLLRFRMGRIAMISDVEKAFLQVRLHEEDRDATRCLWLRNPTLPPTQDNVLILRFTRVPFGLNASPFLLAATTHYHLDRYKNLARLTQEIKENLYVDNLIVTLDTRDEASDCYHKVKQMFKELSMNIREFVCNDKQVSDRITGTDRSSELAPKVLGIQWNSLTDQLIVSCRITTPTVVTKRTVTSAIASIYDPMGWMLPLMHKPKVFLQSLWKDKLDWDTAVTGIRSDEWQQICQEMQGFSKEVPRFVAKKHAEVDIAAFADASTEAIATCIYLKTKNFAHLLLAKGKLPSLKYQITIPKSELNAATLAMRVINSVVTQLCSIVAIQNIYLFTDSEIVCKWIKGKTHREAGIMVVNRLKEIVEINDHLASKGIKVHYGYVPTDQNPADCGTRGLNKEQLKEHYWWTGPSFIKGSPKDWIADHKLFQINEEQKEDTCQPTDSILINRAETRVIQGTHNDDILECLKGRPYIVIKRITATALRFLKVMLRRRNQRLGSNLQFSPLLSKYTIHPGEELHGEEIMVAEKIIIRVHQRTLCTPTVLKSVPQLNIKQDKEGLLRCYGRMGRSCLDDTAKTPYIILQNTWLSEAIIREKHYQGHPGIGHTIALVRHKFWIPKLRAQVTRLIRRCVECQRYNNRPYKYPNQTDLPQVRVQQSSPFQHVGLDYFGPLTVKAQENITSKCYGAIITCMVTRLIYLDVVSDLSTIAFLHMLQRFFGRRGVPKSITSDNAPTFLLGEEILTGVKDLQHEVTVMRELSDREIEWKHITPFAPWQGGFYERLIRSVKHALYKTLRGSTPTFEEMTTKLVEIEALLNTRPLVYMSSDSCNETIIRPIDFLQNKITLNYPFKTSSSDTDDPPYVSPEEQVTLRTKLQTIQALESSCKSTDKFWSIWKEQYLTALREKHKLEVGHNKSRSIPREDDCVLITDPIQPRYSWKMGRITKLVRGEDGEIREAVVTLPSKKQIRRPVNLLVPLELEDRTAGESEQKREQTQKEPSNYKYNLRSREREQRSRESNTSNLRLSPLITLCATILCMSSFSQQVLLSKASTTTIELPLLLSKTRTSFYAYNTFEYIWVQTRGAWLSQNTFPITTCSNKYTLTQVIEKAYIRNKCRETSWNFIYTIHSKFILSNFSMSLGKMDDDVRRLAIISESHSKTELEEHMKRTKEALSRQIATAVAIREDYENLKDEQVFEGDPREQLIVASRLHLAATLSKERYLALCTRFSLLNKCYALSHEKGQEESDYYCDFREMNAQMEAMEKLIRSIEKRRQIAEGNLRSTANRKEEVDKRIIRILQDKLAQRDQELFLLKSKIASRTHGEHSSNRSTSFGCQVSPELSSAAAQTEVPEADDVEHATVGEEDDEMDVSCEQDDSLVLLDEDNSTDEPMDDDQYLGHLIRETEFSQENECPPRKEDEKEERIEEKEEDCRALLEQIDQLEQALRIFPYRMYGEAPRGTHVLLFCAFCKARDNHYSDSCPYVRTGSDRYEQVMSENLCPHCLESCPPGRCRFRRRPCFYCERIRCTNAARLMPRDSGHHKALCTVPDKKDTLRQWINELKQQYIGLRREIVNMKETNAGARVSPKATFRSTEGK